MLGKDDYALARIPAAARHPWWSIAMQRFGQLSALSQFLLGATLGFGMNLWHAFLAITIGAVVLDVVSMVVGFIGQQEGLQTSLLARWTGFGHIGSSVIGLAIALSLLGWFGIQSEASAEGLHSLVGVLPVAGWAFLFGVAVTAIVVWGIGSMKWTAYIAVPLFLILAGWSIGSALTDHSISDLATSAPQGEELTVLTGALLVAGGFMVGAVITPDLTRFNRSKRDVVIQTIIGFTVGEYVIGLIGALLAHAVKVAHPAELGPSVLQIITSTTGTVGVLILVTATLKINDWNLYSGTLGIANLLSTVFKIKLNRATITIAYGLLGSVLAAVGILDRFVTFLTVLAVAFPPIGGIMAAEYYVVKRFRGELDESRARGVIPTTAPTVVPATLVIWALSSTVFGYYADRWLPWAVGSITAYVTAFVLYVAAGRLNLLREVGRTPTVEAEAQAPVPAGAR
jgi:cytosine permease